MEIVSPELQFQVFQGPIGSHQAIAHPLAQTHIEVELAPADDPEGCGAV